MTDFAVGPWKGVRDLDDPLSVPKEYLTRARNGYLPALPAPSSFYGRPGFALKNPSTPLATPGTGRRGQVIAYATLEDGTTVNFVVCGGRLFRCSAGFLIREDVTPENLTIDSDARVYLTPFSNRLVINDGVHTPGVLDDLLASPVTFIEIDYDSLGSPWRAYGAAVVWEGCIFFIVREVNGVRRTVRHAWSQPDDPFTGFKQTDYDNEWDMVQNGASPLMGMVGTNLALTYFRDGAIGYLTGATNDLKTTATHDAIDEADGTRAPAAILQYGNVIYFVDVAGRPMRIAGGKLTDLSKQLRRQVTRERTRWPDVTARTACAVLVPELDVVLFAIWSPDPENAELQFPTVLYAFHADTGTYIGEWTVEDVAIHAMGQLIGINGEPQLVLLAGKVARDEGEQVAGDGGYLWVLSAVDEEVWMDNGNVPEMYAATNRVGYSPTRQLNTDQVIAIVGAVTETEPDLVPASIEIAPEESTVDPGATVEFTAIVRNARGQVLDAQPDSWTSNNESGVSVDSSGVATALQVNVVAHIQAHLTIGETTIHSNEATVNVGGDDEPATIDVTPTAMALIPDQVEGITAIVRNADGYEIPDASVEWHTSDGTKATVASTGDLTGNVIGVGTEGSCNVYATTGALTSNNCVVTCDLSTLTIEIAPTAVEVMVGSTYQLVATIRDSEGNIITSLEPDGWESDDPSVTVDEDGLVTAVGPAGDFAHIIATLGALESNQSTVTCVDDTVLTFVNDNANQSINYPLPEQLQKYYYLRVNSGTGLVKGLIVPAGGGGCGVFGTGVAGGGGAGGAVIGADGEEFEFEVEPGDYLIEVGGRGRKGMSGSVARGINGGQSAIYAGPTNATPMVETGGTGRQGLAPGGGGGGGQYLWNWNVQNQNSPRGGQNGSSGGGAGMSVPSDGELGGHGVAGQGYDGAGLPAAGSSESNLRGAGGGGAGEAATGQNGGNGKVSSITGAPVYYGGGGGGGNGNGSSYGVGTGGLGGGATPGSSPNGTDGLGGGGAATRRSPSHTDPGNGGSGVVIIRIPLESGIDAEIASYP